VGGGKGGKGGGGQEEGEDLWSARFRQWVSQRWGEEKVGVGERKAGRT